MSEHLISETKKQRYERLRSQLDSERQSFVATWRELSDYILPWRSKFLLTENNRGERRTQKIYDSTATYAASMLSTALMSGITNPSQQWFMLTTPDPRFAENEAVKNWLYEVSRLMHAVFLDSNLYDMFPNMYEDVAVFGSSPMMIEEDFEDTIRASVFAVGSYFWANDAKGRVRIFFREFRMTVRQLVEDFGNRHPATGEVDWSRFSHHVKDQWEQGNLETWVDVCHLIAPNSDYDERRQALNSKYKRFKSCYYEKGTSQNYDSNDDRAADTFLRESGYDYFPILAGRWSVKDGDVYATNCPGMTSLGDIKQLQMMERRAANAIDKMINPPMTAPTHLQNKRPSLLPGDVTYVDLREGQQGFRPAHEVRFDLVAMEGKQAQIRQRINQDFFLNVILMMEQTTRTNMTATEIEERKREKMLAMAKFLQRYDREVLTPLIDITFDIMLRQRKIPPAPPELSGMRLKVEYLSILAQAQKMQGLSSIERVAQFATSLAAAWPQAMDKVDFDQMIDEYAERAGLPAGIIVSDDEVAELRVARAQQQAQVQAVQMQAEQSKAIKDLSQADMEKDSALRRVFEAEQQNALAEAG